MPSSEAALALWLVILVPVLILLLLVLYHNVLHPFIECDEYIKLEIGRSISEREKQYWKRERKKLYISLIPILGKFLIRFM